MSNGRWTLSRTSRALVVLAFAAVALVALASPSHAAPAQTCDSVYGCTTTSSSTSSSSTSSSSTSSSSTSSTSSTSSSSSTSTSTPGSSSSTSSSTTPSSTPGNGFACHTVFTGTVYGPQTVEVSGAAAAETVFVVFNTSVIAQGTTSLDGSASVAFQVPAGGVGIVQAVVSGVKFTALCNPPFTIAAGSHVAGVSLLAHTGFGVALLVLAALALIAAGYLMRRRQTHRHAHHF